MSTQIVITEPLGLYDRSLNAIVEEQGVTVISDPAYPVVVPWDKVTEVEWLADKFAEFRVYEFRAAVKALHTASLLQGQFEQASGVNNV